LEIGLEVVLGGLGVLSILGVLNIVLEIILLELTVLVVLVVLTVVLIDLIVRLPPLVVLSVLVGVLNILNILLILLVALSVLAGLSEVVCWIVGVNLILVLFSSSTGSIQNCSPGHWIDTLHSTRVQRVIVSRVLTDLFMFRCYRSRRKLSCLELFDRNVSVRASVELRSGIELSILSVLNVLSVLSILNVLSVLSILTVILHTASLITTRVPGSTLIFHSSHRSKQLLQLRSVLNLLLLCYSGNEQMSQTLELLLLRHRALLFDCVDDALCLFDMIFTHSRNISLCSIILLLLIGRSRFSTDFIRIVLLL